MYLGSKSLQVECYKATIKTIWIRKLFSKIQFPRTTPTKIYLDNQTAIALTTNPKFHSHSKHIDTQYHFTKNQILAQQITLEYIPTIEMAMDIFIKILFKECHYSCIRALGMISFSIFTSKLQDPSLESSSPKIQAFLAQTPFTPTFVVQASHNLPILDSLWNGRHNGKSKVNQQKTSQGKLIMWEPHRITSEEDFKLWMNYRTLNDSTINELVGVLHTYNYNSSIVCT